MRHLANTSHLSKEAYLRKTPKNGKSRAKGVEGVRNPSMHRGASCAKMVENYQDARWPRSAQGVMPLKVIAVLMPFGTCSFLKAHLFRDECLPEWLAKGFSDSKGKLEAVKNALDAYKRLHSVRLAGPHANELMAAAVSRPEQVQGIVAKARQISSLMQLGIVVPDSETVNALELALTDASECITTLQSRFPEQLEAMRSSLQKQPLATAQKLLEEKVRDCKQTYNALLVEWKSLQKTICLIAAGQPNAFPPRTIGGLQQQITLLRQQCWDKLGKDGMALLDFIQGNADFPPGLTVEAIHDALLSLRPFIVTSQKNGGQNA